MSAKGISVFQFGTLFWRACVPDLMAAYIDFLGRISEFKPEEKEGGELASDLDKRLEERITRFVSCYFSSDCVVGEENAPAWPIPYRNFWLTDPLDGTHNSLADLHIFGSMLCYIQNGVVEYTAFLLPVDRLIGRGGVYVAARGEGAWKMSDEKKFVQLVVSRTTNLRDAFLVPEGSVKKWIASERARRLITAVRRSRNNLSLAMALARLADGGHYAAGIDLVASIENKPWDNLPGWLLVEEAGGRVTDWNGMPPSLENYGDLLYSNDWLHEEALAILRGDG